MLTIKRFSVITIVAATLAVPASAAAQGQDLRNPDRRAPVTTNQTQDLRNADRRAPEAPAQPAQDLRNADRRAPVAIEPAPQAPAVTTIDLSGDGFDWGDAAIGAAGAVAIVAMFGGVALAGTQRRRPRVTA